MTLDELEIALAEMDQEREELAITIRALKDMKIKQSVGQKPPLICCPLCGRSYLNDSAAQKRVANALKTPEKDS